jgi:hypothetical protein
MAVTRRFPDDERAVLPVDRLIAASFRVRSVWPLAVVHWTVGVSLDWFILAR